MHYRCFKRIVADADYFSSDSSIAIHLFSYSSSWAEIADMSIVKSSPVLRNYGPHSRHV